MDNCATEGGGGSVVPSANADAGQASQPQVPPHAPAVRQLPGDPIDVAERVLADHSSQLSDDQTWDYYAEVDDEVVLSQATWTLSARLSGAIGRRADLDLSGDGPVGSLQLSGTISHVGRRCVLLRRRRDDLVVNLDMVTLIRLPLNAPISMLDDSSSRPSSWATVLRPAVVGRRSVVLYRRVGQALSGRIAGAHRDHFEFGGDGEVDTRYDVGTRQLVPYRAVSYLQIHRT